ncbi:MAG: DsbA oxidoreductase [Parcubacteria group bacterium LiPW_41]|nr:MAG: DsbA oxidoreductase [Parcubacteria group bacterium LiPW_41]
MEHENKKDYLLPGSILIAALLIAGALFYNAGKTNEQNVEKKALDINSIQDLSPSNVNPISDSDHKLGPESAPIKIIAFSDPECPYCKDYHFVLKDLMKEMPGKIQLIFRNFPLSGHKQSKQEATAMECVADLKGNDAFWSYLDRIFEATPSNDGLDLALLPKFAEEVGVDKSKFESCLASGKFDALLDENIQNGKNAGLRGTPYSVVIAPNGQYLPLNGYLPLEEFKKVMEEVINQK